MTKAVPYQKAKDLLPYLLGYKSAVELQELLWTILTVSRIGGSVVIPHAMPIYAEQRFLLSHTSWCLWEIVDEKNHCNTPIAIVCKCLSSARDSD